MIGFLVPDEARWFYRQVAPRYRIHPMYGTEGGGARIEHRYVKGERTAIPAGFVVDWGLRPVGEPMGGFISVALRWKLTKRGEWSFNYFGSSFNHPGHTCNQALRQHNREPLAVLVDWLDDRAVIEFRRGCRNSGCSHRSPEVADAEVVPEGGLTTSGAPPLFHRVW